MRKNVIIFAIFLPAISASTSFSQINTKALVKSSKPAVVTIHCYNSKKEAYGVGTGFFIAPTHLITDRHVIEQASEVRCVFSDSVEMVIDGIIAEDSAADLVMLECKRAASRRFHPLKLAKQLPEEGEEIIVIGSPLDFGHSVSKGIVSSIRYQSPVGKAIQFTAPVSFGNSGSPVLNPHGEVIGIVSLVMTEGENLNFAAVASSARNLKPKALMTFRKWLHKNDNIPSTVSLPKSPEAQEDSFKRAFVGNYAFGRAADYMQQKDYKAAADMFGSAVTAQPDNAEAWFGLGDALGYQSRYEEAANALEHAVKLRPTFSEAWLFLGKAYSNSEAFDAEKAEAALMKAAQDKNTAPNAWFSLGELYRNQRRYQKAIDAYKSCIALDIADAGLYTGLGHCYAELKKFAEAHDALRIALTINPYYDDALEGMSLADMALRQYTEAIGYLEPAIKHSPNNFHLLAYLGQFYLDVKRYSDAVKAIGRAMTASPMDPEYHQAYGMALFGTGDKAGALKEVETLRKLDSQKATELEEYIAHFRH